MCLPCLMWLFQTSNVKMFEKSSSNCIKTTYLWNEMNTVKAYVQLKWSRNERDSMTLKELCDFMINLYIHCQSNDHWIKRFISVSFQLYMCFQLYHYFKFSTMHRICKNKALENCGTWDYLDLEWWLQTGFCILLANDVIIMSAFLLCFSWRTSWSQMVSQWSYQTLALLVLSKETMNWMVSDAFSSVIASNVDIDQLSCH